MRPAPDDCEDGARMVDALWNPNVRDALAAKLSAARPEAATSIATSTSKARSFAKAASSRCFRDVFPCVTARMGSPPTPGGSRR